MEEGFSKYSSFEGRNKIFNKSGLTWLEILRKKGFDKPDIEWRCYRKIDGSNFSICIEKNDSLEEKYKIRFAKRSGFLAPDEKFQNFEKIESGLIFRAKKLADIVKDFEKIFVYGELYGTVDKNLKATPGYNKINGRIFYGPLVYFTVYDMRIDGQFVDKTFLEEVGRQACFDVLEPLATGTLDELLDKIGTHENPGPWFPSHLVSTICDRNGYLPYESNMEEGLVLVTEKPMYLEQGTRAMIKVTEETEKPLALKILDKKTTEKPCTDLPQNMQNLTDYLVSLCDENRYMSAVSKTGLNVVDMKIAGEMVRDVFSEYNNRGGKLEFETLFPSSVSDEDFKKFQKDISKMLIETCLGIICTKKK